MPSWKTPTDEQVREALRLLRSPDYEAYFLSRLGNPHWIAPLRAAGVLAPPPTAKVDGEGRITHPQWPAGRYLSRMAPHAPEEVAGILSEIETDNPWVALDVLAAARGMPSPEGEALVPRIVAALNSGVLEWHVDEAMRFCRELAVGGRSGPAMALAEALFCLRTEHDRDRNDAELEELVLVLSRELGRPFLVRLCGWLARAVRGVEGADPESGEDFSYAWRQAIEEHSQNSTWEAAGRLVGLVRAGFEQAIAEAGVGLSDALKVLERRRWLVFRRLELHLINHFFDQDPILARRTMMDRSLFVDHRYKHEYAMLMGRRWGLLGPEDQNRWLNWVEEGPEPGDVEDPDGERHEGRAEYWRFCRLHWIRAHLQGEQREFYDRMLEEHGEPTLADLHVYSSGISWGGVSPLAVEDLASLSFEEAVEVVSSWKAEHRDFMGPSLEGLADSFQEYVRSDPERFSAQAMALRDRPAPFVRGFLGEVTEAIKEGGSLDLGSVLGLSEWVVGRPVGERTTPPGDSDALVDPDWQWTRERVSALIEVVCSSRVEGRPRYPLDLRDRLWGLLSSLTKDSSRSNVGSQSEDDPRKQEFLTRAINSPRGKALEAALEYARWVGTHLAGAGDDAGGVPGGMGALPEVEDMLRWQFTNRSVEALAILGSRAGLLYWLDPGWLEARSVALFGGGEGAREPISGDGWAAWNTFVQWVPPHREFYRLFQRQFAYALEESEGLTLGDKGRESPMHHLARHIMVLFGRGDLDLQDEDGPVRRLILRGNPTLRVHAVGFVGRTLWSQEVLPPAVVARFVQLWEMYWSGPGREDARGVPEAWMFGPWFASPHLPHDWAIQYLDEFTASVPIPEPDLPVMERLRELAAGHLDRVLPILDRMVRADREGWRIHLWREALLDVLALGMARGGPAKQQARRTIDYLGRRGYHDFGRLLPDGG